MINTAFYATSSIVESTRKAQMEISTDILSRAMQVCKGRMVTTVIFCCNVFLFFFFFKLLCDLKVITSAKNNPKPKSDSWKALLLILHLTKHYCTDQSRNAHPGRRSKGQDLSSDRANGG